MTKFSDILQLAMLNFTSLRSSVLSYPNQILCYHSISHDNWQYSINPSDFNSQLEWISRNYKVLSLSRYLKAKSSKLPIMAITFDDGYADVYDIAFPIMKKYGFVGTIFLCDNPAQNLTDTTYPKTFLTKHMLDKLLVAGWEVGYHSASHTDLTQLKSDELIESEIVSSLFSTPYFAYPMGHYDQYSLRFVAKNFTYAFTTDPINKYSSNYLKSRTLIERVHAPLNLFKVLLSTAGLRNYDLYTQMLKRKFSILISISNFKNGVRHDSRIYYPPSLEGYTLDKRFYPEDPSDSYYFGYYSKSKHETFAKFWTAPRHNLRYHWLHNEATFYRLYWGKLHTRLGISGKVAIPRYIGSEFNKLPFLMIERINAQPISKYSLLEQTAMIGQSLSFLSHISDKLKPSESRLLPNRSPMYWVFLMPVITFGALIRHPKYFWTLMNLSRCFLHNMPYILKRKKRTLVHRDINEWNILKNSHSIFLIDFQLACIADPIVEIAIMLLKYYHQTLSFKLIMSISEVKNIVNNFTATRALEGYLALFTIYDFYLNKNSTPEALSLAQKYMKGKIKL